MELKEFAEELVERVNNDYDSIIIVDSGGEKGTSKSVFSMQLSKEICKIINYKYSFDLIIFNPSVEKLIELIKTLPDGTPIHIDEAGRVAYKRDFQKEGNKELVKFLKVCRKFRKIVILNDPDFFDLDKDILNLCNFKITCVKRGIAQIRGKSPNPDTRDKWERDDSREKIDNITHGDITDLQGITIAIRQTGGYLGEIRFSNMPKEEYEKYRELSKIEETKGFMEDAKPQQIRYYLLAYLYLQSCSDAIDAAKKFNAAVTNSNFKHQYDKYSVTDAVLRNLADSWRGKANPPEEQFNNNNK